MRSTIARVAAGFVVKAAACVMAVYLAATVYAYVCQAFQPIAKGVFPQ